MGARELAEEAREQDDQNRISERVQFIAEQRSVIDQAKGMIMFLHGTGPDDAFELLRRQSQQHNVKLVLLAKQIVMDLVELSKSKPALDRLDSHGLILTAHQRITNAARKLDRESNTKDL
jgi:hypothetical protein